MNFLAHTFVASRRLDASPSLLFGAALPDFERVAKVHVNKGDLSHPLRLGVDFHHQVDTLFHSSTIFLAGSREIRTRVREKGVPEAASRAIGHLGWELLFDGQVLRHTDIATQFAACISIGLKPEVLDRVDPADQERWSSFLTTLTTSTWWENYRDPEFVAERLYLILRARAKLAFPIGDLVAVTDVLVARNPSVRQDGVALLHDLTTKLRQIQGSGVAALDFEST